MRLALILLLVASVALADRAPPKPEPIAIDVLIDRSHRMEGDPLTGAKEMVGAIADTLGLDDLLSVIVFDTEAFPFVRLQRTYNRERIKTDARRLTAGGHHPDFLPALVAAEKQLEGVKLRRKHVILISNGTSPLKGLVEQVHDMRAAGTTITTVGLAGADRRVLELIADQGEGRLYMVESLDALPRIGIKEIGEGRKPRQ
jgi:uncharacterized protein with von Willebrand factor type A (vWA) domain